MAADSRAGEQSFKKDRGKQIHKGDYTTHISNMQYADLLSIDKNIAWLHRMVFDQLHVKRYLDHYLVVIKASKGKTGYIAFVASDTYASALELAAEFASKGTLTWAEDKWPSPMVKALSSKKK